MQNQNTRIQKQTEKYYQHIVDSLNAELETLQIHKTT